MPQFFRTLGFASLVAVLAGCELAQMSGHEATPTPTPADAIERKTSEPYTGDLSIFEDAERAANLQIDRVMDLLKISEGKVVADIGPGPVGLPDACGGRVSLGVEPLARNLDRHGLLLESDALYLPVGAEELPLLDGSVDVVVARNSLDHVTDPPAVLREAERVLAPGGTLILNVDVDHTPNPAEPHAFSIEDIRTLLGGLRPVRERIDDVPHGHDGRQLIVVAEKPS